MDMVLMRTIMLITITLLLSLAIDHSFAQISEEKHHCTIDGCNVGEPVEVKVLDRHAFSWNLFFKMMTAAFIVGAAVQGVLVFEIFRFRERKQKEE